MSILYEKLAAERDKHLSIENNFEIEVFSQLLSIAFRNTLKPDELPKIFYLENVMLGKNELEALLKRIEIPADVKLLSNNCFRSKTFRVVLK